MPRRKPGRTGSNQHSKGKKRPRGWHRRSRTRVNQVWAEIKRKQKKHRQLIDPVEEET